MRHGRGWWVAVAAVLTAAPGCMTSLTTDPVGAPRKPGHALRPASAPVPPTQEIEVLDPNVHPTGNPTAVAGAIVVPPPECPPGLTPPALRQQIDVPPSVLVHKFYYTGSRTFQGPLLAGGPVIVSVNHPKTLERVYVPVTLPPGAPKVTYTDDTIRYDYGPQSVALVFGPCGNPRVKYTQATEAHEAARERAETARADAQSFVRRTGIPQGIERFKTATKSACGAVADRIYDGGQFVVTVATNALQFVPGIQFLKSDPEDAAAREQERLERGAEMRQDVQDQFVPRAP